MRASLLALPLLLVPLSAEAQSWRLPADGPNLRQFPTTGQTFPDVFPGVRPVLSLYGYAGHPDGHALGVQQVLDLTFGVASGGA